MLLRLSESIDWVNDKLGVAANWLVLLACLISAGNAMIRYAFDLSSNAWLEVQWYMFAGIVMFGASYTLRRNEHVRVDILYLRLSERGQLWVDLLGTIVFLVPVCVMLVWLSWSFFLYSFISDEQSSNAGGLLRWPAKLTLPAGFALVTLQGLSEIIKRMAAIRGYVQFESRYAPPAQ